MLKIIFNILKKIYKFIGFNKFALLNYYSVFYFLNYKKNKNELKIKRINFNKLDRQKIDYFKNKYSNESCVIVGNGPSLNKTDMSKLHNIKTFGVNSIFLMSEKNSFKPSFYMVEDRLVMKQNLKEINEYDIEYKFFPHFYKKEGLYKNSLFFNMDSRFYRDEYSILKNTNIKFSDNFAKVAYAGQTVTYLNMQLAYFMGFKNIYLIGVDFDYVLPKNVIKKGKVWESHGDDPNHFDPRYFGKGIESNDPQLHKTIIAYRKAREFLENNNVKIVNLTKGGKLEVFERGIYDEVFN